ncbi:DNA double-strand break repair nuclease NurA [Tepidibacter formicigenes]|uniref:NurA domain-containing protein n=1 Tax=Tepidibacter formicigenes DSM 15518 TaxID=1123349 RepID=A0A1M6PP52_9FIRM|nr:DNA double-strand break repair nuclease NurA [Tepidibacter formicigenes]SHK09715.1 NurA domain-containing protein [Tepidibacter formicigenes DSM 15518]
MELNNNLINNFKKINLQLKNKYKPIKDIGTRKIRDILDIKKTKKLSQNELKKIRNRGDIIGVDGSKNKIGNLYPHYLMAIQSLAKPMDFSKDPIFKSIVYSPLIDNTDLKESEDKEKNIMAKLEVEVALESIEKHNPYILMMDGSLMTYRIKCSYEWEKLKKTALNNNVLLIGVIEEIKTKEMGNFLKEEINISEDIYDKEILFGLLKEGEYISINSKKSKKNEEAIASCFLRTSTDPNVIGIDFLEDQRDYIDEICNVVYTLTPKSSRGIPIWLDIVDKEVKISNEMMNALVETYIDKELVDLFLKPKRENRSL